MIELNYIDSDDTKDIELAYQLVNNSDINILSDKEAFVVAKDNEMVVGALFVGNGSDHFSFDIVTHPDYKRQGIARLLSQAAMSEYDYRKDAYGNEYHLMIDVVNDMFVNFLVNEYDLNVYSIKGSHTLLTDKEIDEDGELIMESVFINFLHKFKTKDNSNLVEAIESGYNLLHESELTIDDILNDPLLDELGNPSITDGGQVIAYHGTNAKFDNFDNSYIGTNFENTKDGYFFSSDMDYVTWLANKLSTDNGGDAIVYKCKLTLGRTYTLSNYFDTFDEDTRTKMYGDTQGEVIDIFDSYRNDIISKAKYNKCNSVNFRSLGVNLYVVFDSNQIEMIETTTI
jgi:GNAT superfamily N-acetyltransferase